MACPDSAEDALGEYPSVDGAPATVSSSRSWRRSRSRAAGRGRLGDVAIALRFGAVFLTAVRVRTEARIFDFAAVRAPRLAAVRRGAVFFFRDAVFFREDAARDVAVFAVRRPAGRVRDGREALRVADLLVFRPVVRVRAFTLRFAITDVLSASDRPIRHREASLTVYP